MSIWQWESTSTTGKTKVAKAKVIDAITGSTLATAVTPAIAEQIVRDHHWVASLAEALDDAIKQCIEHNCEYHHRTSQASLDDWASLVAEARTAATGK